eukprot:gb/GFBE01044361.1/.p1 GENE.gb/GFBE01044361.1/~~gb/GFBE01044361.1/.p1  ORF type:complete len:558 (+),score=119.96 gb/GFBE01044361.1/:1-1674(+)
MLMLRAMPRRSQNFLLQFIVSLTATAAAGSVDQAEVHFSEALRFDDVCSAGSASGFSDFGCSTSFRQLFTVPWRGVRDKERQDQPLSHQPPQFVKEDLELQAHRARQELLEELPELADLSECIVPNNSTEPPFSDEDVKHIRSLLGLNLDTLGSGLTIASPDHFSGPGGDYVFSWARDSALVASALLKTAPSVDKVNPLLLDYVKSVEKMQDTPDPNFGVDILVEPKFTVPDGKPYAGKWCRPQDDGPGLRAKVLSEFGHRMILRGNRTFVKDHLLTGSNDVKSGGAIARDLDWIVAHWREQSCDLWEEIRSDDFFWNRYTMRAGLHAGAKLAEELDMPKVAQTYLQAKAEIEETLMSHFSGTYVFETEDRRKDAAVIEAFNVGDLGDGLFAPLSKEVLGTVITLNELFCRTFAINRKDGKAGIPGILYGRYDGDSYHGGNAWVLTSAALAQLIYRQASAAADAGEIDSQIYALLQLAFGIQPGLSGRELGDALVSVGDGVLLRIRHHVEDDNLHMAEQIDRESGFATSAKDLSWNYANILLAMSARQRFFTGDSLR